MRFNRITFWKEYKEEFGRVDQQTVDAVEFLLSAFENDAHWQNLKHISYAFATIKHETAHTYRPITEYGGVKYFDKYDVGQLARRLGNTPEKDGDGYKYRGRGFVQLTGKSNYKKYGIAARPADALNPELAFEIMTDGMFTGAYTGKKFSDYITAQKTDYRNARRIINGLDKAAIIEGYANQFEQILEDSAKAPADKPIEKPAEEPAIENPQTGIDAPGVSPQDEPSPTDVPQVVSEPVPTPPQAEGQTIVDVPPVVSAEPETIVSKAKGWYAALPAGLTAFGGGVVSWIQGASSEIILGFFGAAAAIGVMWIWSNYRSKNNDKQREHEAREKQKDRDFELTKLQLESAMNMQCQTVRVAPPAIVVPPAPEGEQV